MRLRLTVKRHGLPETPVVWKVDLETSTISQLLEQVNEAIPIESGDWGFEDYAVELKGSDGVNYECLHYQVVGKVMREDEEVIIRPLLTQDIKIRRVSGRIQISSDGKHLLDGLAYGRPYLRRPADRPPVNIPPLKRRRITYDEEPVEDDEPIRAIKQEVEGSDAESDSDANNDNRQLVLHADFDDDDSEDDEDFQPGEDDDAEIEEDIEDVEDVEEADEDEESAHAEESDEDDSKSEVAADEAEAKTTQLDEAEKSDEDESGLRGLSGPRQAAIRKLHSAFPSSTVAVCKYMLNGTKGDVGEAYEAMTIGFKPVLHKGAVAEASQETTSQSSSKKSKKRSPPRKEVIDIDASDEEGSMDVEMDDSINPLFSHYDQNGLPPGSIASGKALSVMADAMNSSPSRGPLSSGAPAINNRIVKFSEDRNFPDGLTSTPAIDRESQIVPTEEDPESSSEDTSSSDSSSSEEESEVVEISDDTSSSGSDSDSDDSSSDSSSDSDDEPEETSSKPSSISGATVQKIQNTKALTIPGKGPSNPHLNITPGDGRRSTQSRNQRRRNKSRLDRYKEKGILPAGTTITELLRLKDVDENTTPEDGLAALEKIRSAESNNALQLSSKQLAKAEEFEARRQKLLQSLDMGGVDVEGGLTEQLPKTSLHPREKSAIPPNRTSKSPEKVSKPNQDSSTASETRSDSPSKPIEQVSASTSPNKTFSKSPLKSHKGSETPIPSPMSLSNSPLKGEEASKHFGTPTKGSKSPSKSHGTPSISVQTSSIANQEISQISTTSATGEVVGNLSATVPESQQSNSIDRESARQSEMSNSPRTSAAKDVTSETKSPAQSADSGRGSANPTRRTKVDLGASRRLLFGALGMKTPKTKKDEDKLRSDLMKDVRPLVTPKPIEKELKDAEDVVDEDPEAWREKINYRAVECCHEGIILSEPPFPFVQRWDPQQQGWPQKGNRGKKRKQDQSQSYETQQSTKKQKQRKGKHNYAEEQEYLEASYEPSYQDNSMDLSYGEPTQNTALPSDDIDGEVDQQLLNDLNENASTGTSQGPEDLAPLPSDPSTLPDLQDGQAKTGMTIAFKQLDMSEETRWSPLISAWRTAIVISVLENGDLRLSLALRDRKKKEKNYDGETGRRVYGRFEMPTELDDEDEEAPEDDGTFDIGYRTLFVVTPPKVVQDVPADLETAVGDEISHTKGEGSTDESVTLSHGNAESAEAQLSHITETPLHSDAPESLEHDSAVINESQLPEVREQADSSELLEEEFHEAIENPHISEEDQQQQMDIDNKAESVVGLDTGRPGPAQNDELHTRVNDIPLNGLGNDGPSTLVANAEVTTECPICESSLIGVTPDLASLHVNRCLDGNPIPLPELVPRQDTVPVFETSKGTDVPQDVTPTMEPVSDENRKEISQLIKDAGFRSSVPSSVVKDIRPDGMETSDDTRSLEQLRKEMTDLDNAPSYSPKYKGLSPSPDRSTRASESLSKSQGQAPATQSSWQTVDSQLPSSPPAVLESESEPVLGQNEPEKEDEASWETLDDPASPPAKPAKKRDSKLSKILAKSSGLSDARKRWEAMQTKPREPIQRKQSPSPALVGLRSRESSVLSANRNPTNALKATSIQRQSRNASLASSDEHSKSLPPSGQAQLVRNKEDASSAAQKLAPSLPSMNDSGERSSTPTVRYPKFSVGSSFTSQISDHGRQPDIAFEDSPDLNADAPNAGSEADSSYRPDDIMTDVDDEVPTSQVTHNNAQSDEESASTPQQTAGNVKKASDKGSSLSDDDSGENDSGDSDSEDSGSEDSDSADSDSSESGSGESDSEEEDSDVDGIVEDNNDVKKNPVSESNSDSDSDSDSLPSLRRLSQLSKSAALVKIEKPTAAISQTETKNDIAYKKAMKALDDDDISDDDQTTPKASQTTSRKSLFKVPPPRAPTSRAPSSRDLPTWPQRSHSLSQPPASQSKVSGSQVIDLTQGSSDNESEEDEGDSLGWAKKRASSQTEPRRHTMSATSLRASSQASLNTRHGKKRSRY